VIWTIDADIGGTETVQHLIDAKLVTKFTAQSLRDFDEAVMHILGHAQPEDEVVIDTISALANQTRGDLKLGYNYEEPIWDKSEIFFRDKFGQLGYEAAQQLIMRRIRNLRALAETWEDTGKKAFTVTILSHQRDVIDPNTGIKGSAGPDVNPAFFAALLNVASDMFRLDMYTEDELTEDGKVKYPKGTRVLYLRKTMDMIAKDRCTTEVSGKLPKGIINPTLPKLYEVLKRKPRMLVVYAPPGVGKTTLAHSNAQAVFNQQQEAKKKGTKANA
jgi:hypothetical protein